MSFLECIANAKTEKDADGQPVMTEAQAREAKDLFEELEKEYTGKMGRAAASAKAARDAFDVLEREAFERKRRKLLQAQNWKQIKLNLDQYRNAQGEVDIARAAEALFAKDKTSKYSSIELREAAVERAATAKTYEILATFRRNMVGEVRNKAELKDLVREIFEPGITGNANAREMAEAWTQTADYLRQRFNAAGGRIPKRQGWGLPQIHNSLEVRKVSYKEWRDFIQPRLDEVKMLDEKTGLPFTPESLETALFNTYETIRTDGMNKLIPGAAGQGRSLANRRLDHRFLVFKNANAWMEYQDRFGNSNSFDTMFGHIKQMSKDIALMEILGPNPRATVSFIKQTIQKEAGLKGDDAAKAAADRISAKLDNYYLAVTGRTNAPIDSRWGTGFAGLRQLLQAAQLGSASISAITDLNFQRIARSFNGLPQANTVNQYLKMLSPLNAEEKGKLAIRLGLIADGWSTLASAQMRYVGDLSGPEITRRVSDFVMRASLLSPMTQAGRWSFGMEFTGFLADNVGKRFDELNAPLRKTFERYGIDEDRWNVMRSSPLFEHEGASFLRAEDIEARTDVSPSLARDLATRYLEMIEGETNFAVPSSSLRGRIALTGETRPGTVSGELTRSFAMYKNFGITLVNTHLMRGMAQPGLKGKGGYFADLIISTTIMGALALQLKEMSKGRDPRPMTDNAFWLAAFLQGGGLGIYGDFLFSDLNRFDRGLAGTVAGPVVGFADDVRKLTLGNLIEAANGEDTNAARELIRFTARYFPGSSLWYLRLGLERKVIDQLQLMADPKARSNMRRLESRYRREYGQKYWWKPGAGLPSRAPNYGNILESRP